MESLGISGKVAMVTGAAQGIGRAVVQALLANEASVAAVDNNADQLSRLLEEAGAGHKLSVFPTDVRDSAAVNETVSTIERELGPIDILVNVAGVLRTGPVVDMTDEDWDAVFSVNTDGVFYISRAVARRMRTNPSSVIVTVASNAAGVPRMNMGAYSASKAASTMFTKCLGLELAEFGVRCNVVAPGSTYTDMQTSMWADSDGAQLVIEGSPTAYKIGIPLRRIADPADIADAVLFLVSDRARHITMHDLYVDGGAALGV
ncbi:2,3-dihydro-2,3-dihydroxybenzoate dehydrogenase [Longispora sp. K20-0274]|uniref:2,3-dihydro-2,3-dihydroxybenzoate dehydrogenase n=1 Tax=Longispora sp. K20-0274 TaxID=3088255 RepID=UPI00399C35DA